MSNLIKAYSVKYADNIKKLDLNPKADEFQRLYIEQCIVMNEEEVSVENNPYIEQNFERFEQLENDLAETDEGDTDIEAKLLVAAEQQKELEEQLEAMKADAEAEAAEIVKLAEQKAEEIVSRAKAEAMDLKTTAEKQGYQKGLLDGNAQIEKLRADLEKEKQEIEEKYEKQVEEMEPAFVELVISLLKKLTGVAAEDKKGIIMHLIHEGISGTNGSGDYIIHVPTEVYKDVLSKKEEIREILSLKGNVEVIEDITLGSNSCYIETDSRVIDCSLGTHMNGLLEDLKLIAGL